MQKKTKSLIAYTFSHFCVDFTCFFILFHTFKASVGDLHTVSLGFFAYNIVAFGLQPFIGYFCDAKPRCPAGLIGCFLVTAALFLPAMPWAALLLCAFGNACFHVGGGIDSLQFAAGKMTRSGIFVSSGAVGVALGTAFGANPATVLYVPLGLMILSAVSLIFFAPVPHTDTACKFEATSGNFSPLFVLLLFTVIVIRSYAGSIFPIAWKTTAFYMLLPGFASCAGKFLGGILADRWGARRVGVGSLLLSIPFLLFGKEIAVLSVIGIILFHFTMPITLCALTDHFPYHPGLAFGLSTLALLCGTVPAFYGTLSPGLVPPVLVLLIVVSAVCLGVSIKKKRRNENEKMV